MDKDTSCTTCWTILGFNKIVVHDKPHATWQAFTLSKHGECTAIVGLVIVVSATVVSCIATPQKHVLLHQFDQLYSHSFFGHC